MLVSAFSDLFTFCPLSPPLTFAADVRSPGVPLSERPLCRAQASCGCLRSSPGPARTVCCLLTAVPAPSPPHPHHAPASTSLHLAWPHLCPGAGPDSSFSEFLPVPCNVVVYFLFPNRVSKCPSFSPQRLRAPGRQTLTDTAMITALGTPCVPGPELGGSHIYLIP